MIISLYCGAYVHFAHQVGSSPTNPTAGVEHSFIEAVFETEFLTSGHSTAVPLWLDERPAA